MTNWINTVSREHVRRAVEGGFTQADHGKPDRLRRLGSGDRIAFYSPKTDYPDGDPLLAFTAIGRLTDDELYQVEVSPDFHPYRSIAPRKRCPNPNGVVFRCSEVLVGRRTNDSYGTADA